MRTGCKTTSHLYARKIVIICSNKEKAGFKEVADKGRATFLDTMKIKQGNKKKTFNDIITKSVEEVCIYSKRQNTGNGSVISCSIPETNSNINSSEATYSNPSQIPQLIKSSYTYTADRFCMLVSLSNSDTNATSLPSQSI